MSNSKIHQSVDLLDTPKRPLLLDLFCGAGGCAVGYHRAGFDVVGVDIKPQPRYPFEFIQADALEYILELAGYANGLYDAIHASPPCQAYTSLSSMKHVQANNHKDLIPATRALLVKSGLPYVIENVPGAPLRNPMMLCGTMFDGLGVKRHRLFESNVSLVSTKRCDHSRHRNPPRFKTFRHGVWYLSRFCPAYGHGGGKGASGVADWGPAMGIDWMPSRRQIAQAIPPAYTEFIGRQLLAAIGGGK